VPPLEYIIDVIKFNSGKAIGKAVLFLSSGHINRGYIIYILVYSREVLIDSG
jgi:hypothetical protein